MNYTEGFEKAWKAYPHWKQRSSKRQSFAVWKRDKLERHTEAILSHIWLVEGGMYTPGFQVWLKKVDYDEPVEARTAPAVDEIPLSMRALVERTNHWKRRGLSYGEARSRAKKEMFVGGVFVPAKYEAVKRGESADAKGGE